jgi:hypothetical protein
MSEPFKKCIAAIVMHDSFGDDSAQRRHAFAEPSGHIRVEWSGRSAFPVFLAIRCHCHSVKYNDV